VYPKALRATSAQLELLRQAANYGSPTNRPVQPSKVGRLVRSNWQGTGDDGDDVIDVGYAMLWLFIIFIGIVIMFVVGIKCHAKCQPKDDYELVPMQQQISPDN
jgi:hypothetical protein